MKVGVIICNISMVIFDMVIIYCASQGLINDFNWGEADFVMFICAVPLTVIFFIGLLIFIYGYNETLRCDNNI
jgi:hypothetical protein